MYLASMEPLTSSTTQLGVMVVQFRYQTIMFLASVEPVNLSTTQLKIAGELATGSNCMVNFKGTSNFTNNTVSGGDAFGGGGLYMKYKSTFLIYPNTTIYWENNHTRLGGAIFVQDTSPLSYCTSVAPFVSQEECFFQLSGYNLPTGSDIQLVFKNNSADIAGSVLYSGAIDNCKLIGRNLYKSGAVFDKIIKSDDTDYNTTSNISSDPFRLCPCEDNLPNCNTLEYDFPYIVYPGEIFQVSVAAVGQRNGTVPSAVISFINTEANPNSKLPQSQHFQQTTPALHSHTPCCHCLTMYR